MTYFRWRQAPFAQEQMHAGLNRPDRSEDLGGAEARQVAKEIAALGDIGPSQRAKVAIVFSYEAAWHLGVQPQGAGFAWIQLAFEAYSALRRKGLDVDFVAPDGDFTGYRLIVCPSLPMLSDRDASRRWSARARPCCSARAPDREPAKAASRTTCRPARCRCGLADQGGAGGEPATGRWDRRCGFDGAADLPARLWREMIETPLEPLATFADGGPAFAGATTTGSTSPPGPSRL